MRKLHYHLCLLYIVATLQGCYSVKPVYESYKDNGASKPTLIFHRAMEDKEIKLWPIFPVAILASYVVASELNSTTDSALPVFGVGGGTILLYGLVAHSITKTGERNITNLNKWKRKAKFGSNALKDYNFVEYNKNDPTQPVFVHPQGSVDKSFLKL